LVERLAKEYELVCVLPDDQKKNWFGEIGCKYIEVSTDRRGTNPITDYKLCETYLGIISKEKPDVVLTYTVKPNTYGGLAASGACQV